MHENVFVLKFENSCQKLSTMRLRMVYERMRNKINETVAYFMAE